MKTARLLCLSLIAFLAMGTLGFAQSQFTPPSFCGLENAHYLDRQKYQNCVDQKLLFETARKKAETENKLLLVEVGADWCPWCRKLGKLFDEQKQTGTTSLSNYVSVKIARSFKAMDGFHPVPSGLEVENQLKALTKAAASEFNGIPYMVALHPKELSSARFLDPSDLRPGLFGFLPIMRAKYYDGNRLNAMLKKTDTSLRNSK